MDRGDILKLKKYIGEVSRKDSYRVIMFLYHNSSNGASYSVGEIVTKLGMRQTEVSNALSTARKMNLVSYNKVGKFKYYWAEHRIIDRFNRQISNTIDRWR